MMSALRSWMKIAGLAGLVFMVSSVQAQTTALDSLLPVPRQCEARPEAFRLPAQMTIRLAPAFASEKATIDRFCREIGVATVFADANASLIVDSGDIPEAREPWEKNEAYRLEIGATAIRIVAAKPAGVFYALQTLRQLLPKDPGGEIPGGIIVDYPAFQIRGIMHDVGRNFQSVPQLKEQIDLLARYKYNVFHFHVTDNPGWRLESKRHPELQDPRAFGRRPDGIYTQAEFKDLVAYCRDRRMILIPELDVPGHTEAFRRAFNLKTMSDPRVRDLVTDLLEELCTLATPEEMPYVHIGTDEAKPTERVDHAWIIGWAELLQKHGRQVIGWNPGIRFKAAQGAQIQQMWASAKPWPGVPYIDSQEVYINHVDPFELLSLCAYAKPCRHPGKGLGSILCVWHDNKVAGEKDILLMNAVYPALVLYSDTAWRGRAADAPTLWFRLPERTAPEFALAADLERRLLSQRDRFFAGKPFPYLRQTDLDWRIIGPFDHQGDFKKAFPVEQGIQASYEVDGKPFAWSNPITGATIYLRHFWGWPGGPIKEKAGTVYAFTRIWSPVDQDVGAWIGFNAWSRSGRRGAATPAQGQWSPCQARLWLNGTEIAPPQWRQPGIGANSLEIPFADEDYHYRKPTPIHLNKGWNTVLLKIPFGGNAYKWVFTFIPVQPNAGGELREVPGLRFSPAIAEPARE